MVLKPAGLAGWREALADLQRRVGELFGRPEPRRQAGLYLEGLLGPAERKNGWQLAVGDRRPWRTQRVLSHVLWDQDKARDLCRGYVVEHLGAPDGVLIIDETGFLKKGTRSAGVARQYSGTAGRVENCQIGVFLAYASGKGHALIDRELYLPKEWTDDRERCTAAAVPEAVEFATKPRLAQRMIERALTAGVPVSWVLGDEVYDRRLRLWLEQHDRPHVLAVKAPLWALAEGAGAGQGSGDGRTPGGLAPPECRGRIEGRASVRLGAVPAVPPAAGPMGPLAAGAPQALQARRDGVLRRVRPSRHQPGGAGPDRRPALAGRGVLRSGQAGGRAGRLRGAQLAWLVPARHPVDAGAGLPGGDAGQPRRPKGGGGSGAFALPSACPRSAASSPASS